MSPAKKRLMDADPGFSAPYSRRVRRRLGAVYALVHDESGDCYIGGSMAVFRRIMDHVSALDLGVHHSQPMQAAWSAEGIEAFTFTFLEIVADVCEIRNREQHWLDEIRPAFNNATSAHDCTGVRHTAAFRLNKRLEASGRKYSPEIIAKFTEAQRNRSPEAQAERAAKAQANRKVWTLSEETRKRISEAQIGKTLPEEHRKNISQGQRNMSSEARARQTAGKVGLKRSPEAVARIRAARWGKRDASQ